MLIFLYDPYGTYCDAYAVSGSPAAREMAEEAAQDIFMGIWRRRRQRMSRVTRELLAYANALRQAGEPELAQDVHVTLEFVA